MTGKDDVKRVLNAAAEGGETSSCTSSVRCRDAVERIFEYLDGELEGATEEQVAEHFRICTSCYPALAFEESFREALRRVQKGETAPPAVRERILSVLEKEGFTPS